jgi:hypothetical protein
LVFEIRAYYDHGKAFGGLVKTVGLSLELVVFKNYDVIFLPVSGASGLLEDDSWLRPLNLRLSPESRVQTTMFRV